MDTVLYGIGERTRTYIEQNKDERICGILDGYRTDGEFCGIPVISLEELAGADVRIVILARRASERIIYSRIKDFCSRNHIPVYGAGIQKIEDEAQFVDTGNPYFQKNQEALVKLAENFPSVSFDIFDTLLIREVGDVINVFRIVANELPSAFDFLEERVRAELELSQTGCPAIEEIYKRISQNTQTGYGDLRKYLDKEISIEKSVLKPRKEVLQIYSDILKKGKKISLISDMYFSGEVISDFLALNGVAGYEKIYISCEYGKGKSNGLYEIYRQENGGKRSLYIGDDEEKDGRFAIRNGLSAYTLLSPLDMAEISCAGECRYRFSFSQGISLTRLLENPFALFQSRGRLRISSPYELGYCMIGPVAYQFSLWLAGRLKEKGIQDIYFVARDGFVFQQVFDIVTDSSFHSVYLPVSRTLAMMACADSVENIRNISKMSFDGSMEDMLVKRFGLERGETASFGDNESEAEYLEKHFPIIMEKAKVRKRNYRKFLEPYGIADGAAVFDFVSTGTCQAVLDEILDIRLQGFYFEAPDNLRHLELTGFTNEIGIERCENYFLLEPLIKECVSTIREVDAHGKIIYCEDRMDSRQKKMVQEVQRGIIAYAGYMKEKRYMVGFSHKEARAALEILKILDEEHLDMMGFSLPDNFDEFSNRTVKAI